MKENPTFSARFPTEISRIGIRPNFIIVFLILLLAYIFIAYDYLEGVMVVGLISIFIYPATKIKLFKESIKKCQEVIKENKDITSKKQTIKPYLLDKDGIDISTKYRLILLYIMAGVMFPLYLIMTPVLSNPLLRSLNLIIYLTSLSTGLLIYDIRYIAKYYETIMSNNALKIYSDNSIFDKKTKELSISWKYYWKKWRKITALSLILCFIILGAFLLVKISDIMLLSVPGIYMILLVLMVNDIRKDIRASLLTLRQYDDFVKDKFSLIYKPAIKRNTSFLEKYNENIRENIDHELLDELKKKDIRDLFK